MIKFVKQVRFEEQPMLAELLKSNVYAFALLAVIAQRARRVKSDVMDLDIRESLIGDYREYGMTEQNYRTAKAKLVKLKIITCRVTNKGTIATLLDDSIYDINIEEGNEPANTQLTGNQRTTNEPLTTKKNVRMKECKNENNKPPVEIPDEIIDYTKRFNDLVIEVRETPMDDLPGQAVSAMDIMRKRNHTMADMEEILKYLRKTTDERYSWMRQAQITLKSMDGRIKDKTEWRSVYILNQARLLNNKPTTRTKSVNRIPTNKPVRE